MFDALVTICTALFFAKFWSKWRYGYFDYFCAAASIGCAFATPALIERFAPEFAALGLIEAEAGGAMLGCLIYDGLSFGWR